MIKISWKLSLKKFHILNNLAFLFQFSNKTFVVSIPPNEDTKHSNLTSYGLYYLDENNIIRQDEDTIINSTFNLDTKSFCRTQGLAFIYSND